MKENLEYPMALSSGTDLALDRFVIPGQKPGLARDF
jgi:hypothetical protein